MHKIVGCLLKSTKSLLKYCSEIEEVFKSRKGVHFKSNFKATSKIKTINLYKLAYLCCSKLLAMF